MAKQINLKRSFSTPIHELYSYFTHPRLLEKWCAPDGMTLKIPFFEFRNGGRYRYEHTSPQGVFICEGHIRRFAENEMIGMVDDFLEGPAGKIIAEKLSCDITFKTVGKGTEVSITQAGFPDEKFATECEQGWNQCLNKLQELVKDSGIKQKRSA